MVPIPDLDQRHLIIAVCYRATKLNFWNPGAITEGDSNHLTTPKLSHLSLGQFLRIHSTASSV